MCIDVMGSWPPGCHDVFRPSCSALCECTVNASLGHLVMDLNHMLRPAKSPEKCNLQLLDQSADRLVSLFEQKTVKGWWPCTCEQNGEKIIAVRKTNTHPDKDKNLL